MRCCFRTVAYEAANQPRLVRVWGYRRQRVIVGTGGPVWDMSG